MYGGRMLYMEDQFIVIAINPIYNKRIYIHNLAASQSVGMHVVLAIECYNGIAS